MNDYINNEQNFKDPIGKSWVEMGATIKSTEWLWKLWLPKGYLVLLTGESGVGKSFILMYLVGVITNGFHFPDGSHYDNEK